MVPNQFRLKGAMVEKVPFTRSSLSLIFWVAFVVTSFRMFTGRVERLQEAGGRGSILPPSDHFKATNCLFTTTPPPSWPTDSMVGEEEMSVVHRDTINHTCQIPCLVISKLWMSFSGIKEVGHLLELVEGDVLGLHYVIVSCSGLSNLFLLCRSAPLWNSLPREPYWAPSLHIFSDT